MRFRNTLRTFAAMKTRLATLTVAAFSLIALAGAPSASAAGEFCYDIQVNAGGQSVVSQTGCQALPV